MSDSTFIPKAYLLVDCPFSFKFLLFMTESGLLDQVELVLLNKEDKDFKNQEKAFEKLSGKNALYPTIEIEPGIYQDESDTLIQYFADKNNIDAEPPVLQIYKTGVLKRLMALQEENNQLKKA
jgi:hypothetical protein